MIIALCGPSGVGKGYVKQHLLSHFPTAVQPTVVTTRPSRSSDGTDRKAGVTTQSFFHMVNSGQVIFANQPFGIDWYGFEKKTIEGELVITEVHVDNVVPFVQFFGSKLVIVALIADSDYLSLNLNQRGSETRADQEARLKVAKREVSKIRDFEKAGAVQIVLQVSMINRDQIASMVVNSLKTHLRQNC